MELLLVEDDPDDVYFFERAYRSIDNAPELKIFSDGHALLDYLNTCTTPNQVLLLDLNMPAMSGFEVMEALRAEHMIDNLITVCYTTSTHHSDIRKAYQLGAKSYITKSGRLRDLESLIKLIKQYWFDNNRVVQG
ncbi:response regulator [Pseudoalteromonas peptidolytica]|uniref:response regulator n=1 Tax=Pseudoalteromonas peptidolytica TaxID=61150 RepID=UPI00298EACFF|nr:response regulator [Pseudoalteromonas peptidolytica]MDW7549475.1 response regulator [Pseudoalteromonas peptidolytica]